MSGEINRFLKDVLWVKDDNLSNYTLTNIEQMMIKDKFQHEFIKEIIALFRKRIEKYGEKEFQLWFSQLNFTVPEEFQNEKACIQIYEKYHFWFEKEVEKLEKETKLSWEKQTEDIKFLHEKARKVQLVIRHRLSEIQLALLT
ncbi:hypothetical protein H1Z61_04980 [Bacillus aquiflavi]|uniref:Uncharacterized protein n=1 Tax=Bacillus aquiflavi TaxID=2672567 RepID=A0A6B3VZW8_9BACI|nr:hypothetical protein [Bacillus aquiflavi]MBA4536517.1 hypothetical protein [Bacillus aquiflavi]NEY80884.1 hypothetical protein [Bacillus aquiflavi]UAC49606.1 hypothetical protein K6959_07305 [Bacillus aquiflavi]